MRAAPTFPRFFSAVAAVTLLLVSTDGPAAAGVPGPIKVSGNGRHFVDRAGKPFFWLGDTAWQMFVRFSEKSAEAYLRDRAKKGFTIIQAMLAHPEGPDRDNNPLPRANLFGEMPWIEGDPARPNEAYFKRVDHLVRFADQQGLVLALFPTWGRLVSAPEVVTIKNARGYGRWLGARYRNAPNVVWVVGGDRPPLGYEDVWRDLARGLREGDGGAHLITYHPCGWRSSSQYFHDEDWLDFNMIETWTEWAKIYPAVITDMLLTPTKPVVLGEPAYEDDPHYPQGPITPLVARRQAWWAVMAGGFYTFGSNNIWRAVPGWEKSFDTPAAKHMAVLKTIVTARPWWQMVPDQGMFATGVSSERTLNTAVRSVKGDWALVYLASQCTVFVHLDKIATTHVKATWLSPTTGERQEAGTYETGNNGKVFPKYRQQHFSTPAFWEDAVLLLEGVGPP